MKTVILLFTALGVVPAVIVSVLLVSSTLFISPSADFRPPEARRFSLSQRIHFMGIIQGQEVRVDTVLWLPVLVVVLGLLFVAAVVFMLRSRSA